MGKIMRFYEVDKEVYERLKFQHSQPPEKLITAAILNIAADPIAEAPKDAVKFRLYLTKEEFKVLDKKAKIAGVSSASVIRGIAEALIMTRI